MLDHVGLSVSDYAASRSFYAQALRPLGHQLLLEPAEGIGGFGSKGNPFFWIVTARGAPHAGVHVAFTAPTRPLVDAFHAAALGAGGQDNGLPGPRPIYHKNYYAAYVLDPDGNNIEAVCHGTF